MPSTRTRALLLDGAMGTALAAAGLAPGALPEEWLEPRGDAIAAIHAAHVRGGAEVVLTCTFNLGAERLAARGLAGREEELARLAVALARRAGAPRVAGAVGPLLGRDPAPAFRALAAAGADLLWAETQLSLADARAALAAARATGLEVVVTFTPRDDGALPDGTPAAEALAAAAADGACAVGVNCTPAGAWLARLAASTARRLPVPLVAKPSPGPPGDVLAPAELAARIAALVRAGAAWVGGCCGATPRHVAALRAVL